MNTTPYQDRWLIGIGSLLAGYFFATIGQEQSLFTLWSNTTYPRDFAGASLMTGVVWLTVRAVTIWLDHRYDWFAQPGRRLVGQLLLGVVGPVIIALLLATLYFHFVVGQPVAESTFILLLRSNPST